MSTVVSARGCFQVLSPKRREEIGRLFAFLLFTFCFSLFTVVLAASYPITITDELGRSVVIEAEPERIISMLPSHTQTLCAINACDKLVGVDDYSNYPADVVALPKLGGGLTGYDGGPDVEAIVALEPDLVLVSEYGELAQLLEQAGITVYAGSPQTFEDAFVTFELIGKMVNREIEAIVLGKKINRDIDAIAQRVADAEKPTVYYEIDPTPYSVGPNSFIGILLNKAGGKTIVTEEQGDFPQLDPEFIVASDPDVIILADAAYGESIETLQARAGFENLRAISEGRVYGLSQEQNDLTSVPGPRLAEVVRLFAQMLHPDLID
jgi:iron complex transport system substrate-binding protein